MIGEVQFALRQYGFELVSVRGKQARVQGAIRRNPRAVAVAAERAADRADKPDFAAAIGKGVTLRDFPGVVFLQGDQRPARMDAGVEFFGAQDLIWLPVIAGANIHIFDKTHDMPAVAEVFQ